MLDQGLVKSTEESLIAYWQKALLDAPPLLSLPTDRPRPALPTYRGSSLPLTISQDIAVAIKALSNQEKTSVFVILLAAFKVLLYRYTGSEDILIGSSITHYHQPERTESADLFANTLVLRTQVDGNTNFQELLHRVETVALSAYTHQNLPWEKLLAVLQPQRDSAYSPIFQVMFTFDEDDSLKKREFSELTSNLDTQENSTMQFDLTLHLGQTSLGLIGSWEYSNDLFDCSTIERMSGHFQTLLASIIANPAQPISQLPLLTNDERDRILVEWNNTQTSTPNNYCIPDLFEQQVQRTPNAVAVTFEQDQLTYAELDTYANQLAAYLQTLGVVPDVLVGICLERSLNLTVAVLAVLKAGGAYVPLDSTYPSERLGYMLSNSQATVLLTEYNLVDKLPEHKAKTVYLDTDWQSLICPNPKYLRSQLQPENLAYVIYTSGSTGKPKGVAMTQRALVNLILWQIGQTRIRGNAKTLQFSPLSFDVSFQEIFATWFAGGTLVLVSDAVRRDRIALVEYLSQQSVARLFLPFVALQQLAEASVNTKHNLVLREIITAGEQLQMTPTLISFWQQLPDCTLHNQYGPSETHVVTSFTLESGLNPIPALPPIGKPITNTQIYILDSQLQPVPIGIRGELYLGGVGVAREYINRPDLTTEKFISNPFSTRVEDRLYKTGDLARYLADGNIEFLGRIDDQVKVRGYRIELGEIETALNNHPQIQQAIVIVQGEAASEKRLIAYVVCSTNEQLTTGELRQFLRQQLTEYMVPSIFIFLESLPLTPSGKINRRALPAPDSVKQELEKTFVAPRNDLELQLTQIWQRVFGIQQIGINDNFFELGGHSLLAVRLLSEIHNDLGKNLPLATFFAAQTIKQLATVLEQDGKLSSWSFLVLIQADVKSKKSPLFCIHAVWGNVLFYRKLADYLPQNQPVYGLQAKGLDGITRPSTSVPEMAANYIEAIRSVQPHGPYYLVGYSFGSIVAFEIARQLHIQEQEVAMLGIIDTSAPSFYQSSSIRANVNILSKLLTPSTHHLRNLLRLNSVEQVNYIAEKVQWHLTVGSFSFLYRSYLRYIKRSLLALRLIDINLANSKANKMYLASSFPGKLTLFRCNSQELKLTNSADLSWGNLALGGVEIHEIPGQHTTIMEEPDVRYLAEKLSLCLAKAQEENG